MSGRERLRNVYLRTEAAVEWSLERLLRLEPNWSRVHPLRRWFPITILTCFVLVDNFKPGDDRTHWRLKGFEFVMSLDWWTLWLSLFKPKHIVFFFVFYICLRWAMGSGRERRLIVIILFLTYTIELQQAFIAGRECRPLDVLPNLIGAWLGARYLRDREARGKAGLPTEIAQATRARP